MRYQPVHWHEGMFLRPQHFQAADRYWTEHIFSSLHCESPHYWGLRSIELSTEALANHQVEVTQCTGRTREGSIIDFDLGREPDRVDLTEVFEKVSEVMVYLAIPKLVLGRANLGKRYREIDLQVADENLGGGDQEIQFRDTTVRLMLSTDDLQGFETLPIARVKRAGAEEAVPIIDDDYVPPVLAVDAWKPLGLDIIRNITDFVGQRIEVLSRRAVDRGLTFNSQEAGDLDDLLKLIALNETYANLSCLTFASGVHPFFAYHELCRIVGRLAIFSKSRRTPEIPHYDHDDLARIFKWVAVKIKELIGGEVDAIAFAQRYFEGRNLGMRVKIDSEWLHAGWQWYVGVNGQNVSHDECRELLKPGKLNWKMGSDSKVDLIFEYAIPDVEHVEVERPPRALPAHKGWIYYEVRRERDNAAWRDVLAEESLAIRFAEALIGNKSDLAGQRRLEVVLPSKQAVLEFALFAVPPAGQK